MRRNCVLKILFLTLLTVALLSGRGCGTDGKERKESIRLLNALGGTVFQGLESNKAV